MQGGLYTDTRPGLFYDDHTQRATEMLQLSSFQHLRPPTKYNPSKSFNSELFPLIL